MREQAPESFGKRLRARVRRYLFEDARLKLLALLIVTVIWFSVAGQTRTGTPVKIHNLDVTLENVPPGLAVTGTDPTQVNIMVQGPDDQMRELRFEMATQSSDVAAYADLSNLKEGVQLARLLVRGLPDGVSLQKVEPEAVQVTLDPIVTRDVKVEPRFAGTLPDGYKLAGVTSDPEMVRLTGPESYLDKIDKVATTTVSLNNRFGTFDEQVSVITGEDVEVQTRPTLHVTIEEDFGSRSFTVPVGVEAGAGGQAEPQAVTVTLKGPVPALAAIRPSDITATVVPSGTANRQTLAPQIQISGPNAPRVEVERLQPLAVRWRK